MSTIFKATASIQINRDHTNQPDTDGPITKDNSNFSVDDFLSYGTDANQATTAFHDIRSIVAGGNDDLDLTNSLRDAFGNLINFTSIKFIGIKHLTTSASNNLVVGGGSAPLLGWIAVSGDLLKVRPGGAYMHWMPKTGATVTATTGDVLRLNNSAATTIFYEILLIGATA